MASNTRYISLEPVIVAGPNLAAALKTLTVERFLAASPNAAPITIPVDTTPFTPNRVQRRASRKAQH